MNIEMEKQLTDLKNKFSDLKKENKDLVKNLETSESEKRFQKELYQECLAMVLVSGLAQQKM